MKKGILALMCCSLLVLTSCDNKIEGSLNIQEPLEIQEKKKSVVIEPGHYSARIKFKSETKVNLKIKVAKKEEVDFSFKIPKDIDIKNFEGEKILSSYQTGQNFDMKFTVKNTVDTSSYGGTESCVSGYNYKKVCHKVPGKKVCKPGKKVCKKVRGKGSVCSQGPQVCHRRPGHKKCSEKSIPIYGTQSVDITKTTWTKHLKIGILESGVILKASFKGKDVDSSTYSAPTSACY